MMEGFDSGNRCDSVVSVGDRDVKTIDEAARLVLESFTEVDERQSNIKLKLGTIYEFESKEICRQFGEGRHLAALKRLVQREYLERVLAGRNLLILAVDEADKCPAAIARLFRSLVTHAQQQGISNLRFLLAGVSPFVEDMTREDPGVSRFVYRTITLAPMDLDEATELVEFKFTQLVSESAVNGTHLEIDPSVIRRIVNLSGGHPHIVQLLGSHIVENEIEDSDGLIDARDFHGALRRICYEDRVAVYNNTLHLLNITGYYDTLLTLLGVSTASPLDICTRNFPTRINAGLAREAVEEGELDWLVQNNVLRYVGDSYALIDEFLRIRIMFDLGDAEAEYLRRSSSLSLDELRDYEDLFDR